MKNYLKLACVLSCLCGLTFACDDDNSDKGNNGGDENQAENTVQLCSDEMDNDDDSDIDCNDTDCKGLTICGGNGNNEEGQQTVPENSEITCSDNKDNDNNGRKDCDEDSCKEFSFCQPPETGAENTLAACRDEDDNDGDGDTDCDDTECQAFAFCNQGGNNQGGNNDREDSPEACSDGLDNDGDTKIDCKDPDCKTLDVCNSLKENTQELCSDSLDNDNDGFIDAADPECESFYPGGGKYGENTYDKCHDGLDNDGDGLMDCQDPECRDYEICMEGYSESADECPDDLFKFKKDDCECGETFVKSFCAKNITKPGDFDQLDSSRENFIIKQDIDFGTTERAPIMNFSGVLLGGDKHITGVFNQKSQANEGLINAITRYCGLFGVIEEGSLRDIQIAITLNCDNTDYSDRPLYAGALCGKISGSQTSIKGNSKVYVLEKDIPFDGVNPPSIDTAIIKAIGGVFGDALEARLSNIEVTGNTSADLPNRNFKSTKKDYRIYIGGVAGRALSLLYVKANGFVTLKRAALADKTGVLTDYITDDYIGGIAGYVEKEINTVSNSGTITFSPDGANYGDSCIGGIVGMINDGSVRKSSFSGKIVQNQLGARYSHYVGGIAGIFLRENSKIGLDSCQANATFNLFAPNTTAGGIVGALYKAGQYVRNCKTKINLDVKASKDTDKAFIYGGIIGLARYDGTGITNSVYVVNNSARTDYRGVAASDFTINKKIGGICGSGGVIVNNFASDSLNCTSGSGGCTDYIPNGIGGAYVYESYWNKSLNGSESGASTFSDGSAEPYTFNASNIPISEDSSSPVLDLLRHNSAHDGGVLSAHIPSNDGEIYSDWTTETDELGHVIPVPDK